jgi:hypothetical protein
MANGEAVEPGRPAADYGSVSPDQAQAVALAATLSWTVAGIAVVIWKRRQPAGGVTSGLTLVEPASPPSTREAAGFEWPPPESELLRYWSAVGPGLESAARLMGAKGMILWKVDSAKQCLTIHAAYGYSDSSLKETFTLSEEVHGLTTAACIQRRVHTRSRCGARLAAVAVPVEHDGRILGVLSAELAAESGHDDVTPDVETCVRRVALEMAPDLAADRLEHPGIAVGPLLPPFPAAADVSGSVLPGESEYTQNITSLAAGVDGQPGAQ